MNFEPSAPVCPSPEAGLTGPGGGGASATKTPSIGEFGGTVVCGVEQESFPRTPHAGAPKWLTPCTHARASFSCASRERVGLEATVVIVGVVVVVIVVPLEVTARVLGRDFQRWVEWGRCYLLRSITLLP